MRGGVGPLEAGEIPRIRDAQRMRGRGVVLATSSKP